MINPYVLLALGIAWLASIVGAEHFGYTRAENAVKAAQDDAVTQAIADYDQIAEKDKAQAVANAAKEATARTVANQLRTKATNAITEKPLAANCDWNSDSYGLLVAATRAANDNPATGDGLPNAVRAANGASKPAR